MPSEKILENKKQKVLELAEKIKSSNVVILADHRGLTVEEDTNLRKKMRDASIKYSVVKNTLMKFALKSLDCTLIDEGNLVGPTAMAVSDTDVFSISKALVEFAKEHEAFKIKAGFTGDKGLSLTDINAYAEIPSKEVLLSKVLGSLLAPIGNLVRALDAIAKKNEE